MTEKSVLCPRATLYLDNEQDNYIIDFELPGVKKDTIELTINSEIVHIQAERDDVIFHGHLHFPLKVKVDEGKAEFNDGLLKLKVPLKEKPEALVKVNVA